MYITYVPSAGADAVVKKLGEPEIVTQNKSGSKSVASMSSATLTLTFNNLTKISGIQSISINNTGNRIVTNGISISGNTITFTFYCQSSSSTYTPGVSVTAFEIKG